VTQAARLDPGVAFAKRLDHAITAALRGSADAVGEATRALAREVERAIAEQSSASVRVDGEAESVFFNDRVVHGRRQAAAVVHGLVESFRGLGIHELRFSRAVGEAELSTLLTLLRERAAAGGGDPVTTCRKVVEGLWSTGLRGTIDIVSLEQRGLPIAKTMRVDEAALPRLAYGRLLVVVQEHRRPDLKDDLERWFSSKIQRAVRAIVSLAPKHERELLGLALTVRDAAEPAVARAVSTSVLAALLALKLGVGRSLAARVGLAALAAPGVDPPYRRVAALLRRRRLDLATLSAAVAAFHHDAREGFPQRRVRTTGRHAFGELVGLCARFDELATPTPERPAPAPGLALTQALATQPPFSPPLVTVFASLLGLAPKKPAAAPPRPGSRRIARPGAAKTSSRRTPRPASAQARTASKRVARPGAASPAGSPKTASRRTPRPGSLRPPTPGKVITRRTPRPESKPPASGGKVTTRRTRRTPRPKPPEG
jgi:hypothetical protein